ncbi:MAG: glycosyltransferase [Actinobacteria bacterium]|nr:glycosyltransferase [Actinomycetota bacterium]
MTEQIGEVPARAIDTSPRVLAVVVTHNGRDWLQRCLKAVSEQVYPALDVMVIDSGSSYDVSKGVKKLLPEAEFLRLDRNLGFGFAANRAMEVSRSAPIADYYVFIHDDAAPDPECISLLVATAMDTEAGVVGGKAVAWGDPEHLVEVGMSADQFCYPFGGLEEGEIDQGQHDARREVLYVTNACVLVSRALIERCGSWDGGYFALGEDLDLCMRARLAGFKVLVEPSARFEHVQALISDQRDSPATKMKRFLSRRNRPRTIAKNAAAYRVTGLLFIYTLLAMAEMVLLTGFRRFDELVAYPRAFGSFIASVPDVARRRRAVQKRKTIPDRHIRRYMVRDLHRARVFFERRFQEWERGTLRFGAQTMSRLSPTAIKESLGHWLRKPSSIGLLIVIAALLYGLRRMIFGPPLATGAVWPFPQPTGRLLGDYFAGWRDIGLGTSAAPPVALPILWAVGVVSLGRAHLAQVVLVFGLITLGLVGVNRFVKKRTAFPPARLAAVAVYALAPILQTITNTGDLPALAVYAGLPWMLDIAFRVLGPTPGEGGDRPAVPHNTDTLTREIFRLSLIGALVTALAPSAIVLMVALWIIVMVHAAATAWDRNEVIRRARWIFASVVVISVILMPWSLEALRPRGASLAPLFSGLGGGSSFGPLWRTDISSMFFLHGGGGIMAALVAAAILLGAVTLPAANRRREARLLAVMWISFSLIGVLVSRAILPAPVTSSSLWLAVPFTAMALLVGHLVAGMREELPRHALGARHVAAPVIVAAMAIGLVIGWIPLLPRWHQPQNTLAADSGETAHSLLSFFISSAERSGDFRVLWLGERWVDPIRQGTGRMAGTPYLITDPGGITMLDVYGPAPSEGEVRLEETIEAMTARRLHLAGHLLAPASIRFIAVDATDDALNAAMGRQADFKSSPAQAGVTVYENLQWLARANLAPHQLAVPASAKVTSEADLMLAEWIGGRPLPKRGQARFSGEVPRTRHSLILLGDNFAKGWRARVDGRRLGHSEAFGWANRFNLPADAEGTVVVTYARRWVRILWLLAHGLILLIAIAMARTGPKEVRGRLP